MWNVALGRARAVSAPGGSEWDSRGGPVGRVPSGGGGTSVILGWQRQPLPDMEFIRHL